MLHHVLGAEAMLDPRDTSAASSVPAVTAWYTSRLEQIIRRAPEQYWWLHRRWKAGRPVKAATSQAA